MPTSTMQHPVAERRRLARWLAAACGAAAFATAQEPSTAAPTIRAAFAGAALSARAPAIAWLCGSHLPACREWPARLRADGPFALVLAGRELRLTAAAVPLPADTIAAGSVTFGTGTQALWQIATDGTEDWFVPLDLELPGSWQRLLHELEADVLDQPRTLDVRVLVGHLAGPIVDGDPRTALLHLGALGCGEVTWTAWRTPTHLRVRGHSGGGLLLPAVLLLAATAGQAPSPGSLPLRAFAARDGDRAEAARQLVRDAGADAAATLRALLHADDALRLVAIDALVRLRATDELPGIVAAAGAEQPWASVAAADALRELWPAASPLVRQRTRAALARTDSMVLRRIDPAALPTPVSRAPAVDQDPVGRRVRPLLFLGVVGLSLYGFWLRERARMQRLAD